MRKQGRDTFQISQIAQASTQIAATAAERAFILVFQTNDPEFGYNLTTGGEAGKKHTPAAIEKMRQSHRGYIRTEEAKRKTSESLKKAWADGRHTGTTGKVLPDSHRVSASINTSGENHPMYRDDVSTEEIVKLRNQGVLVKEICRRFGISASLIERRINKLGLSFPRPKRGVNYAVRISD